MRCDAQGRERCWRTKGWGAARRLRSRRTASRSPCSRTRMSPSRGLQAPSRRTCKRLSARSRASSGCSEVAERARRLCTRVSMWPSRAWCA
eukprot:132758-Rhodomonas_salina.2